MKNKSGNNSLNLILSQYVAQIPFLEQLKDDLISEIKVILKDRENIDNVCGRVKTKDSLLIKARKKSKQKGIFSPLTDIQDQIGIRIVVFYEKDVEDIKNLIEKNFRKIEFEIKDCKKAPEFGYHAFHFTLKIPQVLEAKYSENLKIRFFELQICTLFQHAWAQANHDLLYKNNYRFTFNEKRKIYMTAAHAWGADKIFSELLLETHI